MLDRISAFDGKTRDKQDFWKRLIWNYVKIWRSTEKDLNEDCFMSEKVKNLDHQR